MTKEEAENAFMCMHCKGCEEICQTNLGAHDRSGMHWKKELKLAVRAGPKIKIGEFLKKVDDSKDYWEMVERNN